MSPWQRVSRRWRSYRRKRQAKKYASGPLREFVYLDEVSVYSLIASRKGPIATDYRDTTSTLLRSEIEGTVGANAGVAKSEVASRIEAAQTSETQTVRKAVIQSTFRELYEAEQDKLALRPAAEVNVPQRPENLAGLRALLSSRAEGELWAVASSNFARGQMVELEVELRAHEVLQFRTVMSSILDILEGKEDLLGGIDPQILREIVDTNQIVERLLVGLVPLKGRVVGYACVTVDGDDWLVHEDLLELLDPDEIDRRAVFVVGVAEEQLFWKDLRRVLFSQSRFLVLARLGRDHLTTRWSPVKLVDVLSSIPQVGDAMAQAIEALPALMRAQAEDTQELLPGPSPLSSALVEYGSDLAAHYGHTYHDDEVTQSGVVATSVSADDSIEARNEAFRTVRDHVANKFGVEVDPQVAADIRRAVLERAGLWPGSAAAEVDAAPVSDPPRESGERYLDAEFVAIYW